MLRLLLSKAQECKDFWKSSKPCHVGIHLDSSLRVLSDEYPFAWFSVIFKFFLHYFVLVKLATSSIRVKEIMYSYCWLAPLASYTFSWPIHGWGSPWLMLSGPLVFFKVTSKLIINSQHFWRRVVSWCCIQFAPSNIFWKLLYIREISPKLSWWVNIETYCSIYCTQLYFGVLKFSFYSSVERYLCCVKFLHSSTQAT